LQIIYYSLDHIIDDLIFRVYADVVFNHKPIYRQIRILSGNVSKKTAPAMSNGNPVKTPPSQHQAAGLVRHLVHFETVFHSLKVVKNDDPRLFLTPFLFNQDLTTSSELKVIE
jgi:hypothetical protein